MPASRLRSSGCSRSSREHGDGEVEVAVLLHVEVDELRCRRRGSGPVQRRQPLDDAIDCLVERPHRQLAGDRRHLDRHVVDVVAFEQLAGAFESLVGFAVAEHGLAEQVEVEADAALAQLRERAVELARGRVDHEVSDHPAEHAARDRDDRPREARGAKCATDRDRRTAGTRAGSAGRSSPACSRLRPATRRSSGRTTLSTNPIVKSSPFGSFSTPASRSALGSLVASWLSMSHRRTSATVSSAMGPSACCACGRCVDVLTGHLS